MNLGNYGAIVVGAGHNGLICAAYLAKAGIRTLVVEARSSVGGCASTEVALGGAAVNICNCDHAMIRSTPIAEELNLAHHGLRYLDVDPTYAYQHWDGGDAWFLFKDVERTLESLRFSYPGDVDNYRRYLREAAPVARMVLDIGQGTPTPGAVIRKSAKQAITASKALPTLLKWSKRSVGDVVRSFFETPQVQSPVVSTGPSVWGLSPEFPNTGLGALGYAFRHAVQIGRPVGGSGALTDSIAFAFEAHGGTIRLHTKVTRVLCDGDRVVGVETVDAKGAVDEVHAPIVVIATDPRVAMVDWLTKVPERAQAMVDRYRTMVVHDGYEAKVDAVLSEPYRAKGMTDAVLANLGLAVSDARIPSMVAAPSLSQMAVDHALQAKGLIAERPQLFVQTPSALDPTVASALPAGSHVFSLEVLWTPYELEGGWANSTEPQRWLRKVSELVDTESGRPFHETVVDWRLMGPREYESQFFMHRGHAVAFSGTPITALLGTNRELSRYETPIDGLFVTGAATFPGAGIWGASGRNAAAVVLRSDSRRSSAARALKMKKPRP
jgi:phytoene dehydrogenase-like protein